MELLTLREQIETLLVDRLGTYTLANGTVVPAMSVRSAGERATARTTVSGLECIIQRQPDITPVAQYTDAPAYETYTVYLVSWDDKEVTDAVRLMLDAFSSNAVVTINPLRVPEGLGPRTQFRLTLQFNPTPAEASA